VLMDRVRAQHASDAGKDSTMATKAAKNQLSKKAELEKSANEVAPVQTAKAAPMRKIVAKTAASLTTKASKRKPVLRFRG